MSIDWNAITTLGVKVSEQWQFYYAAYEDYPETIDAEWTRFQGLNGFAAYGYSPSGGIVSMAGNAPDGAPLLTSSQGEVAIIPISPNQYFYQGSYYDATGYLTSLAATSASTSGSG